MNLTARVFVVVGVVATAACADTTTPRTLLSPNVERMISEGVRLDAALMDGEHDFRQISGIVPEFGGYFFDEAGNLVVLVTDAKKANEATQAVQAVVAGERASVQGEAATLRTLVRTVAFSFRQLRDFRDRANWPLFATPGVFSIDLDEVANRVSIGVTDDAAEARARAVVSALKLPTSAVVIWQGRVEPDVAVRSAALSRVSSFAPGDSLTSRNRPVKGGMEIVYVLNDSIAGCTMMLGVKYGSPQQTGLMTNSHCTLAINSTSPATVYYNNQPYTASDSNRIAHETVDPPFTTCGTEKCRASDAAFAVWDSANASSFAKIARTKAQGAYNNSSGAGTLEIDPANPEFTVTSEAADPAVGTAVYKMGAATGWTGGPVTATCYNAFVALVNPPNIFPRYLATCSTQARYGRNHGDSGSPVFRYSGSSNVPLQGIHMGVTVKVSPVRDTVGNFNRISRIRTDFPTGLVTY